jgi:hypothetical protein
MATWTRKVGRVSKQAVEVKPLSKHQKHTPSDKLCRVRKVEDIFKRQEMLEIIVSIKISQIREYRQFKMAASCLRHLDAIVVQTPKGHPSLNQRIFKAAAWPSRIKRRLNTLEDASSIPLRCLAVFSFIFPVFFS